jgi:NosR/NirI family nitrous oxide reductase transcriptional regulator
MSGITTFLSRVAGVIALVLATLPTALWAQAYEAHLPPEIFTAPDLCAYADCKAVLPEAERFSKRDSKPLFVTGYAGDKPVGYVFLSTDLVDIPAYSGKPVVTLVGMDTKGRFTGIRVLKHSEPILLLGIPEAKLTHFVGQYLGKSVEQHFEVGSGDKNTVGLDAISGATVTVVAENQAIVRAAQQVARKVGILKAELRVTPRYRDPGGNLDWAALEKAGAVARLTVSPEQVGEARGTDAHIDLWVGVLNHPLIGRSVLGESSWRDLMRRLKPHETALFVIGAGTSSFKGSGFVRGGIFDRVQVKQDADTYTFRDLDYLNLYQLAAAGHPAFKESGIFILRDSSFSAAYPFQFVYLANRQDKATGQKQFLNFETKLWLPDAYLEGGRPLVAEPEAPWKKIWRDKAWSIGAFVLFLAIVAVTYSQRDRLAARANHKDKRWVALPKYAFWTTSIVWIGGVQMAQPSVTHVMTWFHSLIHQWEWELFLTDPFIFVFWWFIFGTLLLWGRGLFCGWLCPFGSLLEVAFKVAGKLGLARFQTQLPKALHDKLKWVKYGIFLGLLGISLWSMTLAEQLAEIEPFKTTFLVGPWNRSWPFQLFLASILGISIFIERPFCKYLCPLGAGLAIPTSFRLFGLRRKKECGPCKACAVQCGSQAIAADGRIDPRECLLCLDCMILYHDTHACPPLAKERKHREKNGLPLTPIGRDGYFIPIVEVRAEAVSDARNERASEGVVTKRSGKDVSVD